MEIIKRAEARARKLTRYFTGKACKHGHIAERVTRDGKCLECYQLALAVQRLNQEQETIRLRKWRSENSEHYQVYQRAYHAWYDRARRSKQILAIPDDANHHAILACYRQAKRLTAITGQKYQVDHLMPLSKGGPHHENNLVVMRADFNKRKHAKIIPKWIEFFGGDQ
jgi:5-methylcytosine-specific restriction endonuclease McrA